jgi:hypothetical protein
VRRAVLVCLLAVGASAGAVAAQVVRPVTLPRPPFSSTQATKAAPPGAPRLLLVSVRRNAITDVPEWFARNGLALRAYQVPGALGSGPKLPPLPEAVRTSYRELPLVQAIRQRDVLLLVYGPDFASGYVLAGASPETGTFRYALDFSNYGGPPGARGPFQQVVWAAQIGRVLYVAHAHSTYASSSRGRTAYLTAIDVERGRLLWRNGPLLANANTFDVVGNYLIAGYGFTAEPDALYLLDRRDGRVVQRLPLPGGPEYILRRGRQVFVRTYDRDVVALLQKR